MKYIYILTLSFLALTQSISAQESQIALHAIRASYLVDFPEPITNCAVEYYKEGEQEYLYVFGGLDSTLRYSGIHRRCYKVNLGDKSIQRIQDIPDTLGKIAMAATRINDKIYLAGGYHVFSNGSEKSSSLIHEFDPQGDTFTSRQIVIPVPTDDHIQIKRSHKGNDLLYLIGGWSDNGNIRNVQIFDPSNGKWGVGTPLPDDRYEFFGATGGMIANDNLVYMGGASDQGFFPTQNRVRYGQFSASDSSIITWSFDTVGIETFVYRGAYFEGLFIGGSDTSYNYNATSYSGGKVLTPETRAIVCDEPRRWTYCEGHQGDSCIQSTSITAWSDIYQVTWPMDIRDFGTSEPIWRNFPDVFTKCFVVGGILENQQVSNKIIYLSKDWSSSLDEYENPYNIKVWPNPTTNEIRIQHDLGSAIQFKLMTISGKLVLELEADSDSQISLSELPGGMYILQSADGQFHQRIIKQ